MDPQQRLELLFELAGVEFKPFGLYITPSFPNAYAGLVLPDGRVSVGVYRDFGCDDLNKLAHVTALGLRLVIFPERFGEVLGDPAARWVINGVKAALVERSRVIQHAVGLVDGDGKITRIAAPPYSGLDDLPHVEREAAEALIYPPPDNR